MKKRKKNRKSAVKEFKKTAKKKGVAKRASKKREPNPTKVRKDIALLVESNATKLVRAVIGQGMTGQVAPVKFALEVGNIHPHSVDADRSTEEEDCLAKTLLTRLGIPTSPVVADEYEKQANEVIPVNLAGHEEAGEKEAEKVDGNPVVEESAEVTVSGE